MSLRQIVLVATLAGTIASAPEPIVAGRTAMDHATPTVTKLPVEGTMPSFDGATRWLNSPPLSQADLRGKVVLVNVCTYSCINWLRQLPYVRAWSERYKSQRLVVIGVHSPEFSFEKDIEGVRRALKYARDLHLVMGPRTASAPERFRVLLDGHPPGSAHGLDVDAEGYGIVKEHRLHQLIRQPGTIKDRTFEIQFLDAGVETFSFTFG